MTPQTEKQTETLAKAIGFQVRVGGANPWDVRFTSKQSATPDSPGEIGYEVVGVPGVGSFCYGFHMEGDWTLNNLGDVVAAIDWT